MLAAFPPPNRPAECQRIEPGRALQPILDAAPAGTALCLDPGTYAGPLHVARALTLWGPRTAVIRSGGTGTTIRVTGARAALLGFTVDGSGGRYDQEDAAIAVEADDVRVEGTSVRHAVFGIVVQRSNRVAIRGNEVQGTGEPALGLRGDGIRLWETRHSAVEANHVMDSRDLVVWYSPDNRIADNFVERGRYGTHFMYSSDTVVVGNRYRDDVVGIFVMYSHRMRVEHNLVMNAAGAAGIGLGLKDSGDLLVRDNAFVHDTIGSYVDNCPATEGETVRYERNAFRLSTTGMLFHVASSGTTFLDNTFRDNRVHIAVEGGGDARAVVWQRNHFDDYQGYDLDGDGLGDVPYEIRSFSGRLTEAHPDLQFFDGSPVLSLLDMASHVAPILEPETLLVDPHPRIAPATTEDVDAN